MKNWLIIGGSVLVLILLAVNAVRQNIVGADDERKDYVEQLHFDFSGEIDSLSIFNENSGLIKFHITRGEVDGHREDELNAHLKENRGLWLLGFRSNEKLVMLTRKPTLYVPGDSLCINTDLNEMKVYRKGKEIAKGTVTGVIRSNPL